MFQPYDSINFIVSKNKKVIQVMNSRHLQIKNKNRIHIQEYSR